MNNEQSTTNPIQNKPNQTQFQTHNELATLAGREIATHSTALRAGFLAMPSWIGFLRSLR